MPTIWRIPNLKGSKSWLATTRVLARDNEAQLKLVFYHLMRQRTLHVERLGLVDYESALRIQEQTERAVLTGQQPDTLLLLEHPHTFTLGRRSGQNGVLASAAILRERNVNIFETNRGGKVTYHGPGQLVGYPIINLSPDREDVHRYVRDLEAVLIAVLEDFGIAAFQIKGLTGVHTERGKVAAIGVHIARWVTTHGFALNVNPDLTYFDFIIACDGEAVTSMKEVLSHEVEMRAVEDRIMARFAGIFELEVEDGDLESTAPDRTDGTHVTHKSHKSPGSLQSQ